MNAYGAFTGALRWNLESDPRILGLVALGSMAERGRMPDRWSDHDFFVIAHEAEVLRGTTEWLPHRERIVLWFRETAHGCKAVYDDGHLVEYAVFTPEELRVAKVNDYRVLFDREKIEDRMAEIARVRDGSPDRDWLSGTFLSNVLVAVSRARRGEAFSARWMLTHAMRHLVALLGGGPDDLDPLRRFDHPALQQAIHLEPVDAAREMLAIYENECGGDPRAVAAVRRVTES
jgi:hypothetical protein